jgi:CHAT domain-containing protein
LANLIPGRGIQNVLNVAEVQALLDEKTTLLSYLTLEDQTLIFVIAHDNFKVVASEVSRETLNHQVDFFRDNIEAGRRDVFQPIEAQKLYNSLITPVASLLQTPRLVIVPHGTLHYLPFAALVDPVTNQFLLEQHSLVTLPSASALKFITQHAEAQQNATVDQAALVLGNPETGNYNATASSVFAQGSLDPLLYAEEEAKAIANLYDVKPLLGADATEFAVQEQVARSSVLHIAAHGIYEPAAPLNSRVALAPGAEQDGWLTVGEVYGLELSRTGLVVLSACQTHMGDLSEGDELVGLTRAFFFGKTPTVVATLWNVNDESTRILMEKFYEYLQSGLGKADALRLAQLELLKEGTYAHPYYWSAFVMSGDGAMRVT